jgi:nucleoside 2-deoxyribosyltransferase
MKKIYLAHPISLCSADDVFEYYDNAVKTFGDVYDVLTPMYGKNYLRTEKVLRAEGYSDKPISCNHAIFERDMWMVSQSDIVLCDFSGSLTASIGCSMELAVASWLRKHTVIVLPFDNIHNHAFIKEAADIIFDNMDEAVSYVRRLA